MTTDGGGKKRMTGNADGIPMGADAVQRESARGIVGICGICSTCRKVSRLFVFTADRYLGYDR